MKKHISFEEIRERARRVLAEAGLAVENIDLSGKLVTCGTEKKPTGKDGRYKVHTDFPPTVAFVNYHDGAGGEWQNVQLLEKSELSAMTQAERAEQRERIQKERQASQAESEKNRAKAAEKAARIFAALPSAGEKNGYLLRKGVQPLGDVRQHKSGSLVLPVWDVAGRLISLQFISGEGEKNFLRGGSTRGGFFAIPAKGGEDDGPMLIAEGYATAASVHLATGFEALAAFNAGNLLPVAQAARARFPQRELLLCADNDVETANNPGKAKAEEAARAVGGKVALCPAINGRAADFNDLFTYSEDGPERVRVVIEKARARGDSCPLPAGFKLIPEGPKAGLYHIEEKKDGEIQEIWLGPPLRVLGWTRDGEGQNWGLLLEWLDPDGLKHEHAMPLSALSLESWEWYAELVSAGWLGEPRHKRKVAALLSRVRPPAFIRCVPRVGWHKGLFVLPDSTIGGTGAERVVLQAGRPCLAPKQAGTFEEWQRMAGLCAGNSLLVLSLCVAFAGPLLLLAGEESGGFNLVGGSSTGKSTAQKLAASVWDGPEFLRSWRTSDNGLEGLAALHNDLPLLLDELGQAPPKTINEAAYMLGAGQGKGRAERSGFARQAQKWRLMFLSSGELGLAAKLAENGFKLRPGQEVRFVDLDADAGAGMGIIEELHGFTDSGALVTHFQEVTRASYGHAGRRFLEYVTAHFAEVEAETPEAVRLFAGQLCPENADGQVKRVARRFALCAYAGTLAIRSGVLPWAEAEAVEAAGKCFRNWLQERGSAGAAEDAAILAAVRLCIEKNGSSRFQDMKTGDRVQCINRLGFRETPSELFGGPTEYIFLPESFEREVIAGFSKKRALAALDAAGWLVKGEAGRLTAQRTLAGLGRKRCVVVALPEESE